MKVLILGSGGREHALAWKFSQSKRISGLFVAPGNAGTANLATNLPDVDPINGKDVIKTCKTHGIDMVFVGSEEPLSAGVIDALKIENIPAIGPHREAAQLESSKAFSKKFMMNHTIPTAGYKEFTEFPEFESYLKKIKTRIVLKKSGLAAGKGVLESEDTGEMLAFAKKVLKDDILVAEEFLEGFETSIFALSDGKDYLLLPPCMDFKKAQEGGTGPNTGGMGSICPVPYLTADMLKNIVEKVVDPTFEGLKKEGLMYCGVVYIGLMITKNGPKVLEYNVRFGDPETQALLPVLSSDFGNLCEAMTSGTLNSFPLLISQQSSLAVVVASKGYPGKYPKHLPVKFESDHLSNGIPIFHAGTIKNSDGQILTTGGRCFTVVGLGKDIFEASAKAYENVDNVHFKGSWYRKDIGKIIIES